MTDNLTPQQRSHAMRQVKGKNTSAELLVQQILKEMGKDDYQLHPNDVVGKPDLVWMEKKIALFIHGCFWHGHDCKRGARMPKTQTEYWKAKIARTLKRDQTYREELESLGWRVLTIWECELSDKETYNKKN